MKGIKYLTMVWLALGMLAFMPVREGGIKGTVTPSDGASQVIAIAGADTLRADISSGSFAFANVKKGTYTIWIRAKAPYKDTSVENVAVIDSAITDVGEIKLQQ